MSIKTLVKIIQTLLFETQFFSVLSSLVFFHLIKIPKPKSKMICNQIRETKSQVFKGKLSFWKKKLFFASFNFFQNKMVPPFPSYFCFTFNTFLSIHSLIHLFTHSLLFYMYLFFYAQKGPSSPFPTSKCTGQSNKQDQIFFLSFFLFSYKTKVKKRKNGNEKQFP